MPTLSVKVDANTFQLVYPTPENFRAANGIGGGRWQVITSDQGLLAGDLIQADTSSGLGILTLPATPSVGDQILIEDATNNWAADNLFLARNGKKINNAAADFQASTNGQKLSCVYISAGYGWSIK